MYIYIICIPYVYDIYLGPGCFWKPGLPNAVMARRHGTAGSEPSWASRPAFQKSTGSSHEIIQKWGNITNMGIEYDRMGYFSRIQWGIHS